MAFFSSLLGGRVRGFFSFSWVGAAKRGNLWWEAGSIGKFWDPAENHVIPSIYEH